MARKGRKAGKKAKSRKLYVCGRCGYRSHHHMKCPSCGFHLEEECVKCYSAKGNCICRFHGAFESGRHVGRAAAGRKAKRKKRR